MLACRIKEHDALGEATREVRLPDLYIWRGDAEPHSRYCEGRGHENLSGQPPYVNVAQAT